MWAASRNKAQFVQLLLEHGADVNAVNVVRESFLVHVASHASSIISTISDKWDK